jgi:hypothetical protein
MATISINNNLYVYNDKRYFGLPTWQATQCSAWSSLLAPISSIFQPKGFAADVGYNDTRMPHAGRRVPLILSFRPHPRRTWLSEWRRYRQRTNSRHQRGESNVSRTGTADFYGPQVTNKLIREALHPYAEDLVIVTKVGAKRGLQDRSRDRSLRRCPARTSRRRCTPIAPIATIWPLRPRCRCLAQHDPRRRPRGRIP